MTASSTTSSSQAKIWVSRTMLIAKVIDNRRTIEAVETLVIISCSSSNLIVRSESATMICSKMRDLRLSKVISKNKTKKRLIIINTRCLKMRQTVSVPMGKVAPSLWDSNAWRTRILWWWVARAIEVALATKVIKIWWSRHSTLKFPQRIVKVGHPNLSRCNRSWLRICRMWHIWRQSSSVLPVKGNLKRKLPSWLTSKEFIQSRERSYLSIWILVWSPSISSCQWRASSRIIEFRISRECHNLPSSRITLSKLCSSLYKQTSNKCQEINKGKINSRIKRRISNNLQTLPTNNRRDPRASLLINKMIANFNSKHRQIWVLSARK